MNLCSLVMSAGTNFFLQEIKAKCADYQKTYLKNDSFTGLVCSSVLCSVLN
jgi:hypothetical protein